MQFTFAEVKERLASGAESHELELPYEKRSAVALILREHLNGLHVLMIKRADSPNDPWSGHMAFPGGRMDAEDPDSYHAALRETLEEVDLDLARHAHYLGRLCDIEANPRRPERPNMAVSPFVFALPELVEMRPNYEVAELHWIPLAYLADVDNRQQMHWDNFTLPCYLYNKRRVWGLSLMMLDQLIEWLS